MTFLAQEVIRRKRDGAALSAEEIEWLVAGITDGSVSDAQLGALAMAIVIKGMTAEAPRVRSRGPRRLELLLLRAGMEKVSRAGFFSASATSGVAVFEPLSG